MQDLCFFGCPDITGKGFFYDKGKGKIQVNHRGKVSKKVQNQIDIFKDRNINTTLILAESDTMVMNGDFTRDKIEKPDFGIKYISNYDFFKNNETLFWDMFDNQIWKKAPQDVITREKERMSQMLRYSFSSKLKLTEEEKIRATESFLDLILTSFVLDGLFMQQLGEDAILLEIENPDVLVFQKLIWDFKSIPINKVKG